jgi:hypothetical protein
MKKIQIIAAIVVFSGCASPRGWHWEKQGGNDQLFHMEAGQCRAQALSLYGPPEQKNAVYTACLEGKGWYRVANGARRPTSMPTPVAVRSRPKTGCDLVTKPNGEQEFVCPQ